MGLLPSVAPPINLQNLYLNTPAMRPNEAYWRAKSQGSISNYRPTLSDRISGGITSGLSKAGVGNRTAQRLGSKVGGALEALTPVGSATAADQARRDYRAGNYGGMFANGLGAVLGAFPDGGSTVAHSIIAPLFHGSAAKFDRFANDFISTGEGAQSFGYGHYLSESRRLANSYRNPKMIPGLPDNTGHLYQVSVNANPGDFVNLDAPLRSQPEAVQDLAKSVDLSRYRPGRRERVMLERFSGGIEQPDFPATGQTLHNMFTDYGGDNEANKRFSDLLAQQGFAGLQYGQPVNGLGGGGRNYVVFDPTLIDILNRY